MDCCTIPGGLYNSHRWYPRSVSDGRGVEGRGSCLSSVTENPALRFAPIINVTAVFSAPLLVQLIGALGDLRVSCVR